jgi:hypothetical protein
VLRFWEQLRNACVDAEDILAAADKDALGGNPGHRHRQSASFTKGRGGMGVGLLTLKSLGG